MPGRISERSGFFADVVSAIAMTLLVIKISRLQVAVSRPVQVPWFLVTAVGSAGRLARRLLTAGTADEQAAIAWELRKSKS